MLMNFEPLGDLGQDCVVHVLGECDFADSGELESALRTAARETGGVLIASFVDCSFADCACLGALIRQYRELGSRLMIVAPPKCGFRRVLELTKMRHALPVFDDFGRSLRARAVARAGMREPRLRATLEGGLGALSPPSG